VKDTGIGISQENQQKLFTLFGMVNSSRGINPNGSGIGLTICKKIVEQMEGNIKVISQENVDSTFIVTFKCVPIQANLIDL